MKLRKITLAALVVAGLANFAGVAVAQTKIFVINEERVRRDSKIGKEMSVQLGGIREQGVEKLGLKSLQDQIKSETDALKPQTQSLTPEAINANPTLKAKVESLNKKTGEFLQKSDFLNNQLGQQNTNFNMAFAQVLEPAVAHVAKEAGADVVLSYASTWYVKDAVDLSQRVIARLDATVPTLTALQAAVQPPAPAGGAAQAPRPAAPAAPKPQGGQ
jgi:Skp family chaperone for outer membrane proteins